MTKHPYEFRGILFTIAILGGILGGVAFDNFAEYDDNKSKSPAAGGSTFEKDIPIILDSTKVKFNPIGKHYVCGSGDNFVEDIENEIDYIDVFDMEAYALAKVCYHYHVPFISFKYITDNVNEQSSKDWEENCSDGIKKFKEII